MPLCTITLNNMGRHVKAAENRTGHRKLLSVLPADIGEYKFEIAQLGDLKMEGLNMILV